MNSVLIRLTARQLLGRRRALLTVLAMSFPLAVGVIFRISAERSTTVDLAEVTLELVGGLILVLLLPLVALVLATASLGAEIEDGTAVFLLTKPIERWRIMVIKMGVAAGATILLVVPVTMATTWLVRGSPTADGLMFGLGLGAAVAAILYSVVFVALSAITSRALVIGLIYVFVWEVFVTNLFPGLSWVSIRAYAAGWADIFVTVSAPDLFYDGLSTAGAVIGTFAVVGLAVTLGTRALTRFEVRESA